MGRSLRRLERIDEAFQKGRLSWSKARLVCRVAEKQTQKAWIDHAESCNVRQLERDVARAQRGELPKENRGGLPELRFDICMRVNGLTFELWEKTKAKLAAEADAELGQSPSEEEILRQLCIMALGTQPDGSIPGRKPVEDTLFQLVVDMRENEAEIRTEGGPVPLDSRDLKEVASLASVTEKSIASTKSSGPVTPRVRRKILARDGHCCVHCGSKRDLMAHHIQWLSQGGITEASNLVCLCAACHAMVHQHLLKISGAAPDNLAFLDSQGRELGCPSTNAAVEWEIARKAQLGSDMESSAHLVEDLDRVPDQADVDWWRRHQHLFRWKDGGNKLEFVPGSFVEDGARAPPETPPLSGAQEAALPQETPQTNPSPSDD